MRKAAGGVCGFGFASAVVFLGLALTADGDGGILWAIGIGFAVVGLAGAAWWLMLGPEESASGGDVDVIASANQGSVAAGRDVVGNTFNFAGEPALPSRVIRVTPEFLTSLYKDHVTIQADRLTAAYINQWLRIAGTVNDVSGGERTYLLFLKEYGGGLAPMVMFVFDQSWADKLHLLRRGERVVVEGRIEAIRSGGVDLSSCELVPERAGT